MRKLVYTAFVAFWTVVATIAVVESLQPEPEPPSRPSSRSFSIEEVSRHDSAEDCWMGIEGGVYDLTDYLPRHPAPRRVIVAWCGREASRAMRSRGDGTDHSERAWRLLERYRIGRLNDS